MGNFLTISVVTATWNAGHHLPRLIKSLQNQTDRSFNWIIADGASTDGTLDLLKDIKDLDLRVLSQPDFGIYDALNRAVGHVSSDYYLVVGADDWLATDAIQNFRTAAVEADLPDLVAAAFQFGRVIVKPKSGLGWLYGMGGVSSSHSVGLLIKRSLHEKHGMYSRRFPITADQFFIKTALKKGASITRCSFVSGEFTKQGNSAQDDWGVITELFRVQVETERWIFLQFVLLMLRCSKCYLKKLMRA